VPFRQTPSRSSQFFRPYQGMVDETRQYLSSGFQRCKKMFLWYFYQVLPSSVDLSFKHYCCSNEPTFHFKTTVCYQHAKSWASVESLTTSDRVDIRGGSVNTCQSQRQWMAVMWVLERWRHYFIFFCHPHRRSQYLGYVLTAGAGRRQSR
jgi:hypothetical protein